MARHFTDEERKVLIEILEANAPITAQRAQGLFQERIGRIVSLQSIHFAATKMKKYPLTRVHKNKQTTPTTASEKLGIVEQWKLLKAKKREHEEALSLIQRRMESIQEELLPILEDITAPSND